ncbi:MAG: VWA domain-containing protein [Candidatus Solibacter usitatus]|nr:VWA domain-containing protein [Candidatus Solibacter usitatus]
MRRLNKAAAQFAALAAVCAFLLSAQKQDDEAVFRTDTNLVMLHATVVDKNGHLITDLPQNAFQVFENGVEQRIKIFKREDVPVSMGLVVDNSGSMRDKRQKVEAAALAMVKASNRDDEVFVVNFNDEPFLDSPDFTNDLKVLEQSLSKIDSRGGTAMRDAIRVSIDHEKQKAKRDKKVLLVITDGNDNASMISQEALVKAAQQSEIIIYAIGLLSEEERREARRAKRSLDTLTEATGGQSYYPKELSDVEKICHQVAHDIRNQYIIAYTPTNTALDGTFRQVRVAANGPGRPVVRTRTGYYATPDKAAPKTSTGGS